MPQSITISVPFLNVVRNRVRSVNGAAVQVTCPVTIALADSGSYWHVVRGERSMMGWTKWGPQAKKHQSSKNTIFLIFFNFKKKRTILVVHPRGESKGLRAKAGRIMATR